MTHSVGSGKARRRQLTALVVVGLASLLMAGCNSGPSGGGDIQKDMGSGVNAQSDGSKAKAGASSLKPPPTAGDPGETFVKPGGQ